MFLIPLTINICDRINVSNIWQDKIVYKMKPQLCKYCRLTILSLFSSFSTVEFDKKFTKTICIFYKSGRQSLESFPQVNQTVILYLVPRHSDL